MYERGKALHDVFVVSYARLELLKGSLFSVKVEFTRWCLGCDTLASHYLWLVIYTSDSALATDWGAYTVIDRLVGPI